MSRESFLTSAEWTKVETALYAIADRLTHDAMDHVLDRDPKAIVHAAGVVEGLKLAAKWPYENLRDEDSPASSPDPSGTIDIKVQRGPNHSTMPRLQDTF